MAQISGSPAALSPRITASFEDEGGDPGSSITNIIVNPLPDGVICWAISQHALYGLDKHSVVPVSFPNVLQALPSGRWIRIPEVTVDPDTPDPGNTLVDGAYREVTPAGDPFYSSYIWWTSVAKVQKILEQIVTRNPAGLPTQINTLYYDTLGALELSVTDDITYVNLVESTRTRTIA
jgi:hypothetical protein